MCISGCWPHKVCNTSSYLNVTRWDENTSRNWYMGSCRSLHYVLCWGQFPTRVSNPSLSNRSHIEATFYVHVCLTSVWLSGFDHTCFTKETDQFSITYGSFLNQKWFILQFCIPVLFFCYILERQQPVVGSHTCVNLAWLNWGLSCVRGRLLLFSFFPFNQPIKTTPSQGEFTTISCESLTHPRSIAL